MFLAPLTAVLTAVNLDIGVLLLSMTEIKQTAESPQTVPVERPAVTASPAEPAHVERVTEKKAKDQKKWRPGVQALPPGKSGCSNSFRQPRNHYVHLSAQLTTTTRLLLHR